MIYTAKYGHSDNCTPGHLLFDANSDRDAERQARKFVADGYRNGTWLFLETGRFYVGMKNQHGDVVINRIEK